MTFGSFLFKTRHSRTRLRYVRVFTRLLQDGVKSEIDLSIVTSELLFTVKVLVTFTNVLFRVILNRLAHWVILIVNVFLVT